MQIETLNPIKIKVFGEERFDFLQNIITNDLNKLDKKLESYILSPQGKILYQIIITKTLYVYENGFIILILSLKREKLVEKNSNLL